MSTEYTMDQLAGRINVIAGKDNQLGQVGVVSDTTVAAGSQLATTNSGRPIGVRIVKKSGATSGIKGGLGVKYKAGYEGTVIDALSTATSGCDGIVDPALTTDLADGDTFLLYESGPIDYVAGGTIAAGANVKPTAAGEFIIVSGNEPGVGRNGLVAAADGNTQEGFFALGITAKGLIA